MARKYSKAASKDVERAMHKRKEGTLKSGPGGKGGKVKSRKQAIAIGLSEARREDDEYGVDRLTELMGKHRHLCPKELVSICLNDLAEFTGATPRSDDLTLLALQRTATA